VFLINVPIAAIAFVLGFRYVVESRDPQPGSFDLVGAALSIAALVSLVYGIVEAPEAGWTDDATIGALGMALGFGAGFVAWELRCAHPMLDLSFFRNPRFSIASLGVSLASFSLFGSIFALTQFMQFAHGYSALEAGAAMVPLAVGLVIGAGTAVQMVQRLGTTRVVAGGMLGLAGVLAVSVTWTPDMPYWPLGIWFFACAVVMGWIMGPCTESVMGAVPAERAGVASAMNDVTRQVAGALGTAVIGSLIASLYGSRVEDSLGGLNGHAAQVAKDSIGGANDVAATLPRGQGDALVTSAGDAFTEALGIGFVAAACVAVVGAVLVLLRLPADHLAERGPLVVAAEPA
jgi:hypothetical protein